MTWLFQWPAASKEEKLSLFTEHCKSGWCCGQKLTEQFIYRFLAPRGNVNFWLPVFQIHSICIKAELQLRFKIRFSGKVTWHGEGARGLQSVRMPKIKGDLWNINFAFLCSENENKWEERLRSWRVCWTQLTKQEDKKHNLLFGYFLRAEMFIYLMKFYNTEQLFCECTLLQA